jgi:hypothetical protein
MSKSQGLFGPAGAFTASSIQTREGLAGRLVEKEYYETLSRLPNLMGPTFLDMLAYANAPRSVKADMVAEATRYNKVPMNPDAKSVDSSFYHLFINYRIRINSIPLQGFGRAEFAAALSQLQFAEDKSRKALLEEVSR